MSRLCARRLGFYVAPVCATVSMLVLTVGASAQGELSLIHGKCATLNSATCLVSGMHSPQQMSLSADGHNAYILNASNYGVTVLDRDRLSGALRQKAGTAGCITFRPTLSSCEKGAVLTSVSSILASEDGKNLYALGKAGSAPSVVTFQRDQKTGALSQAGCVSLGTVNGSCKKISTPNSRLEAMTFVGAGKAVVLLNPDKSYGETALLTLPRDPSSGDLNPAVSSCLSSSAMDGCVTTSMPIVASSGGASFAKSPANGATYLTGDDAVVSFTSSGSGQLTPTGCISPKSISSCNFVKTLGVTAHYLSLTVAPDGHTAYAVSASGETVSYNALGVVSILNVATNGKLTARSGKAACLASPVKRAKQCTSGRFFPASRGITLTPNGRNAYINSYTGKAPLTVFTRKQNGALAQFAGENGCFAAYNFGGGCTVLKKQGFGSSAVDAEISSDGRFYYLLGSYPYDNIHTFAIHK